MMEDLYEEEMSELKKECNSDHEEYEGELCPDCGGPMRYECISTDADGNRPEMGFMCPKCD